MTKKTVTLLLPFAIGIIWLGRAAQGADALGLDVYSGNGTMNWTKIAAAGKTFAFVKATEGTDFEDPDLGYNEANGTATGMYIGCYDFAHPELNTPAEEAEYFVDYASQYHAFSAGHMVPALDMETGDGASVGTASLSVWCNDWCADVYALTGVHPVIYTGTDFASDYLNSSVIDNPLWIASPSNNPTTDPSIISPWTQWTFWQYGQGAVNGDPASVADLDKYNGTLATLVSKEVISVPEPTALGRLILGSVALLGRRRRKFH
jgi:lysozyme